MARRKTTTKGRASARPSTRTVSKYVPYKIPRNEVAAITYKTPSEIRQTMRRATSKKRDSKKAGADLAKLHTRLGNIANKRMRELEKSGYAYYAYDRIQAAIKANNPRAKRIDTRHIRTPKDYYTELLDILTFLQSESSTVEGQKRIRERRLASFRSRPGFNISDEDADKFLDWLGSWSFNQMSELLGSDVVLGDMELLFQEGVGIDEILDMYDRVTSGVEEYEDAMERLGVII